MISVEDDDSIQSATLLVVKCQNGHNLSDQDIDPEFLPFVRQRRITGEVQLPIHPDSCLLCQANEKEQRDSIVSLNRFNS